LVKQFSSIRTPKGKQAKTGDGLSGDLGHDKLVGAEPVDKGVHSGLLWLRAVFPVVVTRVLLQPFRTLEAMTTPQQIQQNLSILRTRILRGEIGTAPHWQGADVVILGELPGESEPGFYPDPLFVRTDFPDQLSWLFYELKAAFVETVDFDNKFYFYGTLAETAILYCDRLGKREDVTELLLEVLSWADRLASQAQWGEEIPSRTFN
jgi:hypothetical protein